MSFTEFDARMKSYEQPANICLPNRLPVITRIDGKSFSSYTKTLERPFDLVFINAMNEVARNLCKAIDGAQIAYTQSDEISILIHNYKKLQIVPWGSNRVQKIVSWCAGIASAYMTAESVKVFGEIRPAVFDARVFVLPEAEVCNYFLWRQNDCTRNSIISTARSLYSNKELFKKSTDEMQEMVFQKDINWNEVPVSLKRGRCIVKERRQVGDNIRTNWVVDNDIPRFSADRDYIEKLLVIEQE